MYLQKDTENIVILELTLKSSYQNPYYLFELISNINPDSITYFTGTDLSSYKCRYNKFQIIETGTSFVNLTASTVNLRSGSYTMNLYEASAMTLFVSATTGTAILNDQVIVDGEDLDIPLIYR